MTVFFSNFKDHDLKVYRRKEVEINFQNSKMFQCLLNIFQIKVNNFFFNKQKLSFRLKKGRERKRTKKNEKE